MCLLTFISENAELNYADAKEAANSNPDGFGFAIHTQVGIIHDKDMDFEKLWLRWADLRRTYKNASLWHFRITTHGTTNLDNCHPFVTNDGKSVLAHNGILPITMPLNDLRSDTRIFTELVLPAIGGVSSLDEDKNFSALEKWAGTNKIVILSSDPKTKYDYYIVNEALGHWKDNVWFSNSSYKKFVYANYNYTGYYSKTSNTYSYAKDKEDWNLWETDCLDAQERQASLWDEQLDFIEDELYPNEEMFRNIKIFTEYIPDVGARATCYNCGCIYYYDPETEISSTHCGSCMTCMACNNEKCGCWEKYEYGLSTFESNYNKTTTNKKNGEQ